jgi:hypothetical protein
MTNREKWKFNILFVSENEIHKQETEKWLDDLFSSTSMRRTITGEKGKNVVIREVKNESTMVFGN